MAKHPPQISPSAPTRPKGNAGVLGLVGAGAFVGTLLRAVIEGSFPVEHGSWPWATFLINILGSFFLGLLLELLERSGEDTGWRRNVRFAVGTGVIGGFTTYSTFVLETYTLADSGGLVLSVAYALVSAMIGVGAALAGFSVAGHLVAGSRSGEEGR